MSYVILSKNSYSQLPLMQSLASRVLSEKTFYIFQCFSCIISDTSSYSLSIFLYIFNSYSSLYSILKQHVTTLAFCFVLHLCRTSLFRSVAPLSQKISSSFFREPSARLSPCFGSQPFVMVEKWTVKKAFESLDTFVSAISTIGYLASLS